jgi:uncharacterized membrane protein
VLKTPEPEGDAIRRSPLAWPGWVRLGCTLFGVSLTAFGLEHVLFGDFVAGRAPAWPPDLSGRLVWAYLSGAVLITTGALIVARSQKAWAAALITGAIILIWAFGRHVPVLLSNPRGAAFTATGKAMALSFGCFAVVAAFSRGSRAAGSRPEVRRVLSWLGGVGLPAFMILGGIQHFMYTQFVATLVPAWIPGPIGWAYFAGVALIAGGLGILFPPTRSLAALMSGLMIGSWVFLLHLPRALAAVGEAAIRNEWTALFEAMAFAGNAFILIERGVAGGVREAEPGPAFARPGR